MTETPEVEVLPPEGNEQNQPPAEDNMLLHFCYGLLVGGFFTAGLTTVVALIITYVKRHPGDAFAFSHLTWVMRSAWISIAGFTGVLLLTFTIILAPVAGLLIIVMMVWNVWRIFKGWSYLFKKQPLSNPHEFI